MALFLEQYARIFMSFHGFISIIALASLGAGVYLLYKRAKIDWGAGLTLSQVGIIGYIITFILGLLIYPVFRVKVRAEYFDPSLPWATGLFEIKEHIGSIGLFIAIALLLYYYAFEIADAQKPIKQSFITLLFLLFLITIAKAIIGVILVGLKSI